MYRDLVIFYDNSVLLTSLYHCLNVICWERPVFCVHDIDCFFFAVSEQRLAFEQNTGVDLYMQLDPIIPPLADI